LIFWFWRKKNNANLFLLIFWLVNILLILPLKLHPYINEGERYGYLPSVAVAILIANLLFYLWNKNRMALIALSACLLIYFSTAQVIRLDEWRVAGQITKTVTNELKKFDYSSYKKTFILGLPQSYHGAPIMRNGVTQFLQLSNIPGSVERVPVYLKDGVNLSAALYSDIENKPDGILATSADKQFIFEGKATENLPEYKYELWGYDYGTNLAPNIRLQFQGGREFDWARGEVQLLYFDQGKLQAFSF